jgi:SAM-dependent methyltransferase
LHHIPSHELRLKFLSEARRVLKKNGIAVFTVWNLWQKKGIKFQIKYFLLKILGLSRLDFRDVLVPYSAKNAKIFRYYHAFTKKELKDLFLKMTKLL